MSSCIRCSQQSSKIQGSKSCNIEKILVNRARQNDTDYKALNHTIVYIISMYRSKYCIQNKLVNEDGFDVIFSQYGKKTFNKLHKEFTANIKDTDVYAMLHSLFLIHIAIVQSSLIGDDYVSGQMNMKLK